MDKSFETLYQIAMSMADTCLKKKLPADMLAKLEEEYQELKEAFSLFKSKQEIQQERSGVNSRAVNDKIVNDMMAEAGDVLFVLLHIAHQFKKTPFDLLHAASTKMLARINDNIYIDK